MENKTALRLMIDHIDSFLQRKDAYVVGEDIGRSVMKGSPRGITSELLGNKDSEFKLIPKWTIPRRAAGPCIYNKASLNFILSRCFPIFAYLQMRPFRSFEAF